MEDIPKVKELTDNEFIILLNEDKNPLAYQEIVIRYRRKLFTYLYRLVGNREESEDLLQNVFIKVYKNSYQFDVTRKFSSWIYRIAHNEGVNFLKRRDKKRFISWEDIVTSKDKLDTKSDEVSPLNAWIDKEIKKEVQDSLDNLPGKYKQVLTLRYFTDKSYYEISKILEKPVNTVGTLLNRAKKKLEKVMEE